MMSLKGKIRRSFPPPPEGTSPEVIETFINM
jgi:hypothetical protein